MGRGRVDQFARLFVMPQTGHCLSGSSYNVDGNGKAIAPAPIPNRYDQTHSALRPGGKESGAANVGDTDGRRSQPAALLVSDVSTLRHRTGNVS